ncbi:MAG: hypothetical protein GX941_06675 [Candidatus Methanofastidiosa archaeon]|mgnify:CR=1 FL=1|nr:hypothetical protein [Candidatus Methanofastidiosa archaeon]HPC81363.1 hypothetical protein [Methanofastidiosum sp.]HRS25809.1 hypothetical protein [Methanofastidiosum sp.]
MTVQEKDLIFIKKSKEMDITAEYLANKRILFEYPRKGYGEYGRTHIPKIKIGILGELAVLEYLIDFLTNEYGNIDPIKRWEVLHNKVGFSYLITIGKFDGGHEFKIGKTKPIIIDVKTYHNNQVSVSQIFNGLKDDKSNPKPLNLFIDKDQNPKADIYIQTFINNEADIILSGFNEGLPPLATWMPNPAYTKSVPELTPMKELLNLIKKRI